MDANELRALQAPRERVVAIGTIARMRPHSPGDRCPTQFDYWVELAKLLERGKFDALFLADVLGVYDVYRGSPDAAIANAVQVPVNDPLLLIPAIAYVTRNLGSESPARSPTNIRDSLACHIFLRGHRLHRTTRHERECLGNSGEDGALSLRCIHQKAVL